MRTSRFYKKNFYKNIPLVGLLLLALLAACSSGNVETFGSEVQPEAFTEQDLPGDPSTAEEVSLVVEPSPTEPQPTDTSIPPTKTPFPETWQDWPVIPNVSQRAIEIYQRGIELGNDPHSFSKIGDCQNISTYFLAPFENPAEHSLGEYTELQDVIDWYYGSYSRDSLAVAGGLNVARVLSPFHADIDKCEPGENSLSCEVRVNNPSVAIVSLEENWGDRSQEDYEGYLRTILDYLIDEGVVPILVTKADNFEGDHAINISIVKLAAEYDIPLWNFWAAVQPLPNHGLEKDGFHLTLAGPYFDSESHMENAWPWRNLTALQSLNAVLEAVNAAVADAELN